MLQPHFRCSSRGFEKRGNRTLLASRSILRLSNPLCHITISERLGKPAVQCHDEE